MSDPRQARPKGTRDFVPPASELKRHVEYVARRLSERYGYREVVTPTFEHTEVFVKSSGDTSDIVTKEMYSFQDRAGRDLTLRPEGTPGVIRAILENRVRMPVRLFYVGPFFRYGRPQKGRYREFLQYGVEAIGEASPMTDAEVVMLGDEFFRGLGITDCSIQLNSIGCRDCRPAYREKLVGFLNAHRDELCDDCQVRTERSPLRAFDCKNEKCRALVGSAPKPLENLCLACEVHFRGVREMLDGQSVRYELNDRLARGLDYYGRTVFEYVSDRLGAQDSLGGGGRYDYLVEQFGGPETPAVGFAIGLDRTMLAMPEGPVPEGGEEAVERRHLAFVVWMSKDELGEAVRLTAQLRSAGIPTQMDFDAGKPKRQFKTADAVGASCCVIIGPDELAKGAYSVKDLVTGDQSEIPNYMIVERVRSLFR